ncbi:TPA: AEC family transporter [Streptococcus suis]
MDLFLKILGDKALLGAVFSTIFIILMGYYARKKNIVPENASKVLSAILLNLTLPALAFNAFMVNINEKTFKEGLSAFVFGFIAYALLIAVSFVIFAKYKGDKKDTLRILMIFGSTTFFGLPIINAILPSATLYANLFNIAYRVFLYSYALVVMSGKKFDKGNVKDIILNPIVLATFIGFALWILQPYAPKVDVTIPAVIKNGEFVAAAPGQVAFYRVDLVFPWIFTGLQYLGNLSSPLAWLAIGMTLASISLKDAVKDKDVWVYSVVKMAIIPLLFLGVMIVLNLVGGAVGFNLGYEAIFAVTVMLATPPATVAVAYAINYEKESVFASNASLLSTVVSVFAIIVWVIILTIMNTGGMI